MTELESNIVTFCKGFYSTLDFAHDISHGQRVVNFANRINQIEKADSFLVEYGAWLHQFHDNLAELNEFLSKQRMDRLMKEKLFEIVEKCRPNKIDSTELLEAKIVFDADALDLIGSFGFIREVLCNFAHRKFSWDDSFDKSVEVQQLFINKLQTETAKEMSKQTIAVTSDFVADYLKTRRNNGISP